MLVYFDPWMAGVVYPGLIIVGLIAMPYIDVNPKGNGYYTLKERPFAIVTWLFGFLILWVVLIFFGTFLRGPNWSFFGPYEFWDRAQERGPEQRRRQQPLVELDPGPGPTNRRQQPAFAAAALAGVASGSALSSSRSTCSSCPVILRFTVFHRMYENMGAIRYVIMVMLLLFMALMPIKMVLRWLFNLKYFIYLPEFNASL